MTPTLDATLSQVILLPGLLLLFIALASLALASRFRRSGWLLLAIGVGGLAILSMPVTAHKMIRTLEHSAVEPAAVAKAQAIVVLSGGILQSQPEYASDVSNSATLERMRYAAFLYHQHELPVLVTGGSTSGGEPEGWVMKRELETIFSVPVHWVESDSVNTAENALFSRNILEPLGVNTIALITHAWHMPRAKQAFERAGFTVIAAPTVFHIEPVKGIMNVIPQAEYFKLANTALHEWVGMVWYRMRG